VALLVSIAIFFSFFSSVCLVLFWSFHGSGCRETSDFVTGQFGFDAVVVADGDGVG
jgi:hypothetical protein